jgi:SAM-dependent methyltransferase
MQRQQQPEFDAYASQYDEMMRNPIRDHFGKTKDFFHVRKWQLLKDYFSRRKFPMAESSWLDVGCGKAELLSLGSRHFKRVCGCDPSLEMTKAGGGVEVLQQPSATKLPFDDCQFDFVTAVCVYHHVEEEDRIPLTREIHRVLRPQGLCCIIEHNPWNPVTSYIVSRLPMDANAHLLSAPRFRHYAQQSQMQPQEVINFLWLPEGLFQKIGGVEKYLEFIPLGGQYAQFVKKGN